MKDIVIGFERVSNSASVSVAFIDRKAARERSLLFLPLSLESMEVVLS